MGKKIIIIGGGFSGLSAASYLAKQGHEVTLLEKNERWGGRADEYSADGFRFDMGPSWYMMPEAFEQFFQDFGHQPSDYYSLKKLDPYYRVFFDEPHHGEPVDMNGDVKKIGALFEQWESGAEKKFHQYLKRAKYKYEVAFDTFLYRNFTSWFDFLRNNDTGFLLNTVRWGDFLSLQGQVHQWFEDQRIRQLLLWHSVFVGGTPRIVPATYSLMLWAEYGGGVWYPQGGFSAVVDGFARVAREQGADLRVNQEVEEMVCEEGRIISVRTKTGEHFSCDAVLSSTDYRHFEQLLPQDKRQFSEKQWQKKQLAPATFCIYWGLDREIAELKHHNYVFRSSWQQHFQTFEKPRNWPQAPSYYIGCPSKTDPNVAPAGSENLFVLIPVASGLQNSAEEQQRLVEYVIDDLSQRVGLNIRSHIVHQKVVAHRFHAQRYNAYQGNALGLAHTLWQSAHLRPPMAHPKLRNVFACGQFSQPGTGTPLAVISGKVAAEQVSEKVEGRR